MEIRKLSLKQGAKQAQGMAVIIDVFRAFSCEPLMFHLGAKEIILEADVDRCKALRDSRGGILVGEVNELPIPGFDLTNSPYLIVMKGRRYFEGQTVIHRTTSGVAGTLIAVKTASEVLLGSFMTAKAIGTYIQLRQPTIVSLVAMGIRSQVQAPEDEACSDYIESLLTGKPFDWVDRFARIIEHETAQKFLRGDRTYLPKEDVAFCMQRDLFDFVLRASCRDGQVFAERVEGDNNAF
ncbi:MAG: 2-phosphosulfolactate phosphatase [Thermodesulfovibrionales bacterium]|jgi:2-phosphosulfolactate phosphatase